MELLSFFLSFSEEKLREENFKRKWPSGEAVGSERCCRNGLCKGFFFSLSLSVCLLQAHTSLQVPPLPLCHSRSENVCNFTR